MPISSFWSSQVVGIDRLLWTCRTSPLHSLWASLDWHWREHLDSAWSSLHRALHSPHGHRGGVDRKQCMCTFWEWRISLLHSCAGDTRPLWDQRCPCEAQSAGKMVCLPCRQCDQWDCCKATVLGLPRTYIHPTWPKWWRSPLHPDMPWCQPGLWYWRSRHRSALVWKVNRVLPWSCQDAERYEMQERDHRVQLQPSCSH